LIWKKKYPNVDFGKYLFLAKSFGSRTRIVLINKEAFRNTVNKNIDLFRKMIHSKVTADSLLEQMKDEDKKVYDILNGHEALMGILLGFGRHNSLCFEDLDEMESSNNYLMHTKEFISKREKLNKQLKCFRGQEKLSNIERHGQIGFRADHNHPETKELKEKYNKLCIKTDEIYSRDDWFEKTLRQLLGF
jgi:hypothetical protein